MNTPYTYIKNISAVRLGMILSFAWITIGSGIYFSEIYYPSPCLRPVNGEPFSPALDEFYEVHRIRWDFVHDYLSWDTFDIKKMKVAGDEKKYDWYVCCPGFSTIGFLKFVLFPILMAWLFAFFIFIFVWPYRQNILESVLGRYHAINSTQRIFIIMSVIMSYMILDCLGISLKEACILIFLISIVWFIIKSALAGLVYAITKAIEDAKRDAQ